MAVTITGNTRVIGQTTVGVVNPPLLDTYIGQQGAYSLRKLRTAYAGSAIRVRRTSDNTEQDIGFDINGDLDTISLLSFVGSGSGFVRTWYDQTTQGRNLIQTNTTFQPRIVNAGTIDRRGSKPAIIFDGSNDNLAASTSNGIPFGPATFYAVSSRGANTTGLQCIVSTGILSNDRGYGIFYYDSSATNNLYIQTRYTTTSATDMGNYNNTININTLLFAVTTNTLNSTWYNGGNLQTASFSATNTTTSANVTIGSNSQSTFYLNGSVSEVIIWTPDYSASRTGIEQNINAYYNIY